MISDYFTVMNTDIDTKQAEICDLLKKVLKKDDDKKEPEVPEDRLKDPTPADPATAPEAKVRFLVLVSNAFFVPPGTNWEL